jgi:hypothetical protein
LPDALYVHRQVGDKVHFWPLDGWDIPSVRSAIVEAYPPTWRRGRVKPANMTDDQYDAYTVAD